MPILDTHCHLHGKEYTSDLKEVISRARLAEVTGAVLIGVDLEDSARAIAMAQDHDEFFRAVAGVHPHEAKTWESGSAQRLKELLSDSKVCALGEIGLDYHYDFSPREMQRKVFVQQLEIARGLNTPIVIHCREAYEDVLQILSEFYPVGQNHENFCGVLHCYFGTMEQAQKAFAMGFVIGIGGSCTFKKTQELQEIVAATPLSCMVLETDAPYMAPIPYRGKRNEPAYLQHVVSRIAELKQLPTETVMSIMLSTARILYGL